VAENQEAGSQYVIVLMAQKCRGLGQFWNGLPWVILSDPRPFVLSGDEVEPGLPLVSVKAVISPLPPPERPPQVNCQAALCS